MQDILYSYAVEYEKPLWLNLGCGTKIDPDYINIDMYSVSEGVDIQPDLQENILEISTWTKPGTIEKIRMVHVLEHFYRWEACSILQNVYEALTSEGTVEIEMPDLDGCILFYTQQLDKDLKTPIGLINRGLVQFYGNQWNGQVHETHKYVWTKKETKRVMTDIGFNILEISNEARYHYKGRDMYIMAQKP